MDNKNDIFIYEDKDGITKVNVKLYEGVIAILNIEVLGE